jgi:DNA-binding NarL/FixJ family response regulator
MAVVRVLIVEDHLVVRQGLRSLLSGAEDIEVVGEASDATEALEKAMSLSFDVVLLDIRMPGMDGLRVLSRLKDELPDVRAVVLTNYDDEQFLLEAFRVGAYAYLLKNVSREELLQALRSAHRGERMLSQELVDTVLRQFAELSQRHAAEALGLSGREIELLALVAQGLTNRQIAEHLFWSEATVKRKLSDIFRKLNVHDRAQAVAVAARHNLL